MVSLDICELHEPVGSTGRCMGAAFFPLFGDSYYVARSVFYATQGMRAKANMIDAGYTAFAYDSVIHEKWIKISKKLSQSTDDRNKLTHGQFFGSEMERGKNTCIVTPLFSVSGKLKGKNSQYYGEDIDKIRIRAASVRDDLSALGVLVENITRPGFRFGSHHELDEVLQRLELVGIKLPKLANDGILETVFGAK